MNTTKKIIAVALAFILSLGLCACASDTEKTSQNRNTIEYVNGTKEHIMFSEIKEAYENNTRENKEKKEKYEGSILSGGGTITYLETEIATRKGNVPIAWTVRIHLDNGTPIRYYVTNPNVDLYEGDKILFNGRITNANRSYVYVDVGCWYKDGFVKYTEE